MRYTIIRQGEGEVLHPADPGPWAKSSLSSYNSNCVEVSGLGSGEVCVRNSRDPGGAVLRFTAAEWDAFLGGARLGEFDRPGT